MLLYPLPYPARIPVILRMRELRVFLARTLGRDCGMSTGIRCAGFRQSDFSARDAGGLQWEAFVYNCLPDFR